MARKSRSKSRRTYKAPKRRKRAAPARSRKRAAVSRRKRARRNPKGIFGQPAVQYGIAATLGAGVATALDSRPDLRVMADPAKGVKGYSPALVAAAITFLGANFLLKGKQQNYAYAAGVGMLLPTVAGQLTDTVNKLLPAKNGNGYSTSTSSASYTAAPRSVPAPPKGYKPSAKRSAVMASTSRMMSA